MTHRSTCVCSTCPGGRYEAERHERAYSLLGIVPGGETRVLDGLCHVENIVRVLQHRQTIWEPSWAEIVAEAASRSTTNVVHDVAAERAELEVLA